MKKTVILGMTALALALASLTAATPSFASGDCGPVSSDSQRCYLENMAYLLGNNNLGGGGIGIIPRFQMAVLP